jgi:hypothetical protein
MVEAKVANARFRSSPIPAGAPQEEDHPMLRFALLIVALMTLNACAGVNSFDRPPKVIGADVWQNEHFRRSHPDLMHRLAGQAHFEDNELEQARAEFALAAGFGDKLSQAMLGEIYWEGHGVNADRSLAYAWMDLAAERGFVSFVAKREQYWQALAPDERVRALELGSTLYQSNGDQVALPRMGMKLKQGLYGSLAAKHGAGLGRGTVILPVNGSRVTMRGGAPGAGPVVSGGLQLEFGAYFAREFWRLDQYVAWQEAQLELARRGMVEVGPLKAIEDVPGEGRL